jgi:hypothetical protein
MKMSARKLPRRDEPDVLEALNHSFWGGSKLGHASVDFNRFEDGTVQATAQYESGLVEKIDWTGRWTQYIFNV